MRPVILPFFIPHQGCPFQCIYCNQHIIASRQELSEPGEIARTIEKYLQAATRKGPIELAFFGGSFTALERNRQEGLLRSVQPYLQRGSIAAIRISTRPDFINEDILSFLVDYGVKTVELGVQSLDDPVLEASRRGYQVQDVIRAVRLIQAKPLRLGLQLMVGLPGENESSAMATAEKAASLKPDMVRVYPTLVLPGTALHSMYLLRQYRPLSLSQALHICKRVLLVYQYHQINVIRMGLQPSTELRTPGNVIAGPFHPAFGERVEQEIFKDQARHLLQRYRQNLPCQVVMRVHPRDLSRLTGWRRQNVISLQREFPGISIQVQVDDSMEADTIGFSSGEHQGGEPVQGDMMILTRRQYIEELGEEQQ